NNKVKGWRIATVLLLCFILVSSLSCNPFSQNKPQVTQQLAKVARGDLSVTVSGSGNIATSNETKLTFGVAGRIDKIYVEEGDRVKRGDILARLETDTLELAVIQAHVDQAKAQLAVTQSEVAVTQAKLGITQAGVTLQTATLELDKAQNLYKWPDMEIAQANVDKARHSVQNAHDRLAAATTDETRAEWIRNIALAEANLIIEERKLNAMLSYADTEEVAIKKRQVEAARQSLELSNQSLAQNQQSLELTRKSLDLTQRLLEQAERQLEKAVITAPFDGAIVNVSADEKDTVSPTTPIIHLIDSGSMELKIQVDEIDIAAVKTGQKAIIKLDALPNLKLDGKVSSISLLSSDKAGVIVYDIKIKFNATEGSGLRAGMSANADIVTTERTRVLLIPDRVVKKNSQGNTVVDVLVNGQAQERMVVTGISNGTQTEIVSGLEEGETVVENRAQ
ncbi:MAG: efflux RND transporter periplasmic adaptor subunit, partial [Chloroflexi bacterium]|nr:efflux RND transporter periplasmic adaptor subunit [Chloroflexota bacterium]